MLGPKCSPIWPRINPFGCQITHLPRRHASQRQDVKPIKSLYIDTQPPTPTHIQAAKLFFQTHTPSKSWTATEWRKNQPHNADPSDSTSAQLTPEVTFLGRSNSGKSSLLNALLLSPGLCRVGPKPGKTVTMHAWSLSPLETDGKGAKRGFHGDTAPRLNVLDMPGYGHGAHGDWGTGIMKYLTSRRQLRRAFVLVNPAHGLKKSDLQMLELLRVHGVSHQMIASKCDHDGVGPLETALLSLRQQLERQFGKDGPALLTIGDILAVGGLGDGKANLHVKTGQMKGVEDVRWAVLRAAGLEEYALACLANGGVPPKSQIMTENTTPESKLEDIPDVRNSDSTKQVAGGPLSMTADEDNIGIGIDAFMAMADMPEEKAAASKRFTTSRQQRMRRRAVSR